MDILHLIDRLEEMVGEARRLPIGAGVVLDRRRLLDLVDQMRAAVPNEVKEAARILEQREDLLARAEEEASLKLARCEEEVARRLDEQSLVQEAQARATMIVQDAEARADRIIRDAQTQAQSRLAEADKLATEQMDEADRYALEMLRRLEDQLNVFLANVRSGVESLTERQPAET